MKKVFQLLILFLLINNFADAQKQTQQHSSEKKPFVLGEVDTIQSTILSEKRILNIYLPDGYSPDSAATYSVIYLLDGSADEDFIHIAGLVQYYNFPWISRFPRSIVVGIANVNRKRDFTFAVPDLDFLSALGYDKSIFPSYGGSDNFILFIEKEVQPFIQKNYKTNTSKTLIGESLGGLLATEILLKKPTMFDTYLIISPSLWWGKESLLTKAPEYLKTFPDTKLKIYVGVGNEGNMMVGDAKALSIILQKYKKEGMQVYYDYLPDETHATIMHQAVYDAFKLLYPVK